MNCPVNIVICKILAVSFILFFFNSCSDNDASQNVYDEKQTLRYQVNEKINSTQWTDQLEPDRLNKALTPYPGIVKSVKLNPLAVISAKSEKNDQIFPFVEGFGSIDTSLLPSEMKSVLDGFCKAISTGESPDIYMAKDCIYSLAIFNSDFSKIANKNIKRRRGPYFTSYIYGQPFIDENNYEVPVRFKTGSFFLDIKVFLLLESPSWKIDQIQIIKWGNLNDQKS